MNGKKKLYYVSFLVLMVMLLFGTFNVTAQAAGKVNSFVLCGAEDGTNGAIVMKDALKNIKIPRYKVSASRVRSYTFDADTKGNGTTWSMIKKQFQNAYNTSTSSDLNIFYYTGHSGVIKKKDGTLDYSGIFMDLGDGVTVPAKNVILELAKYKGKFMLILDTCYSYGYYKYGAVYLSKENLKRFGFITASGYNEKAENNSAANIGFFTERLLEGLGYNAYSDMPADTDRDGIVTPNEVVAYARKLSVNYLLNMSWFAGVGGNTSIFQFAYTKQTQSTVTIDVEETLRLKANVLRSGDRARSVKWKTSNKKIAAVNSAGKITGVKVGTAVITSYLTDKNGNVIYGSESRCKVTVKPTIEVTPKTRTLYPTQKYSLKATVKGTVNKVKWSSSKSSVVTVNSNGTIAARKVGTATITASVDGVKATCKVTVKKPTITLSKSSVTIQAGKYLRLKATVKGVSQKVTWTTSNRKIVVVNSSGLIRGIRKGTATITATANGVKATCKVRVLPKSGRIELSKYVGKDVSVISNAMGHKFKLDSGFYLYKKDYDRAKCMVEQYEPDGTPSDFFYSSAYYAFGARKGTTKLNSMKINGYYTTKYMIHGVYIRMSMANAENLLMSNGWRKLSLAQRKAYGFGDPLTSSNGTADERYYVKNGYVMYISDNNSWNYFDPHNVHQVVYGKLSEMLTYYMKKDGHIDVQD